MAAGAFVVSNLAKLNVANATNLWAQGSTLYRVALVTSAWTPAPTTNEVWGDVSANELATANGYTAGGGPLTGYSLTQTAGVVKLTFSNYVWTAAGGSIAAFRYFVIYALGTFNTRVNPLVAYALGDNAPADVPATTTGNTLTFTPHANGIETFT